MTKKIIYIVTLFLAMITISLKTNAQYIIVKDTALARLLCDSIPSVMSSNCKQLDTVKAKKYSSKIIGYKRGIVDISEITYFKFATDIVFEDNAINKLPDFSDFPNLITLNLNGNALSGILDFSKYTQLQFIVLNRNNDISGITGISQILPLQSLQVINCNLTTAPNFGSLSNLKKVYLYKNHLTYKAIVPLTAHAKYASFTVFPQNSVPATDSTIIKNESESFTVKYGNDTSVSGLTYFWYFNKILIKSGTENYLTKSNLSVSDSGSYFVSIKSNNPLLLGDSIISRTFKVLVKPKTVEPCPSNFSYNLSQDNYCDSIILTISVNDIDTNNYSLYLENSFSHKKTSFINSKKFNIRLGTYSIIATNGSDCSVIIDTNKRFDYKNDCTKYFTPNGDGNGDSWLIQDIGKVKIINAQGQLVKELECPAEWDGSSNKNIPLPDGMYIIILPNGSKSSITLFR